MQRTVNPFQVGSTPTLRTMKNNLGNYTHQVDNPDSFLRFDLTEGDCWFKDDIKSWFKEIDMQDIIHYPDERILKTKKLLARWLHMKEDNIAIGNGSDELIELIQRIFTNPEDKILTIAPSFFRYTESSLRAKNSVITIKLNKNNFEWDNSSIKKFLKKAEDKKVKLIWLASPNNPTGIDIPGPVLLEIIKSGKIVILDKVLNGFTKELREASMLVRDNSNLLILSGFSKTFGLPGLRFGFAVGHPTIIESLEKWHLPFNVSGPTLFIVEKLIHSLLSKKITLKDGFKFIIEREFLKEKIARLKNIKLASDSKTNFILLRPEKPLDPFRKLLEKGILVTNLNKTSGIKNKNFIRVTLGDRQKNILLLKALQEIDLEVTN